MAHPTLGTDPAQFLWASGIEDTFVPQTRAGHRALDEYELMGHYEHWREDLALARELGLRVLRWGVPWYRVEPTPGSFDWRWIDEVLPYMVEDLGITPIVDLMHYGCPFWLRREFATDEYPRAVADYAAAFAQRYKGLVRWYTPLNEPIVNALMCGMRGIWPPYLKGDAGYIKIMLQLARGIVETIGAIREVDPGAVMVHVEAAGLTRAFRAELVALAQEDQRRGFLCYDLVTGRITPEHPLFPWLVRNGASLHDLATLVDRRVEIDVMGLNFYPQWSTTQVDVDDQGRVTYRIAEQDGAGFRSLITDYYERYRVPVMITETSAFGEDETRARWLEASVATVRELRSDGVPVIGYTWFPMFTMVDWKYRTGKRAVEHYHIDLGLFKLRDSVPQAAASDVIGRWVRTPLVRRFRELTADPVAAVGHFAATDAA